ncbi:IS3 family transposase [Mesomycoplasma dispar]|uniref:IS3 family transposase n=1 Tax=Mesomycoplasma dispar TaxID=86660 RepID=UPI000AFED75E|nr:IS3 family transposase [Mesomycoplasma dispar]
MNVDGKIFENLEDAHQKISSFVKWYNKTRVQSCLSYLSPNSHFQQFDTQKNFHNFGE